MAAITAGVTSCGQQRDMGLGSLGDPGIVFKRKFRWTLAIGFCYTSGSVTDLDSYSEFVPEELVKMGARPNLDVEETQIDYLHGRFWLPGKVTYQTMAVTYYDVAGTPSNPPFNTNFGGTSNTSSLFDWIATVYDITDPVGLKMGNRKNYEGLGILVLYDGCGYPLEIWTISGMWPQAINFGELDMTSSDLTSVELTIRYRQIQYSTCCPTGAVSPCGCDPCGS